MTMKRYRAVLSLAAAACVSGALMPAGAADLTVYFGTHTAGPGKGFSVSRFNTETGALSKPEFLLETPAPAYFVIAPGGRRLYACNSTGFVSAYSIDAATARLSLLNQKPSGGGDPSYISLDTTGHYVFVANYDGGNIAAWALAPDGSLGERTAFVQHTGSGIKPSAAIACFRTLDPRGSHEPFRPGGGPGAG